MKRKSDCLNSRPPFHQSLMPEPFYATFGLLLTARTAIQPAGLRGLIPEERGAPSRSTLKRKDGL
nr:hypothetical protein [uncultured Ottowia sp.]